VEPVAAIAVAQPVEEDGGGRQNQRTLGDMQGVVEPCAQEIGPQGHAALLRSRVEDGGAELLAPAGHRIVEERVEQRLIYVARRRGGLWRAICHSGSSG
jgi:hypothetical protein